ncbi:hypothetical protein EVG20_g8908 [Dentipellis fragilis]|uniref:F-box domain-containing protein n=1 Tax=Dentipellis fragilis TaxID=205917 RepID=A0A4Y9Y1Z9_9AGAM|nr:hypothetical protein EVG20_g8908 [Dentipellis fragilis]
MLDYAIYIPRLLKRAIQSVDLTHVCRQWRIVAIDHPGLWSHIIVGTKFTDEFLRRSHREPNAITYTTRGHSPMEYLSDGPRADDMEDLAGIISQNLSRTQSLHLTGTPTQFTAILPMLLSPAPVLEEAILKDTLIILPMGQRNVPSLPSDFFSQSAPRLRHLHLHGWTIPWPSITFNTLIYLHLSRPGVDAGDRGEFGEVLSALSRMPLLEVLHLRDVLPPACLHAPWQPINGPKQVVALPSLRELVLTDTARGCYLVLDHIAAPPITEYQIDGTDHGGEGDLFARWLYKMTKTSLPICELYVSQMPEAFQIPAYSKSEGLPEGKLLFDLNLGGQPEEEYTRREMEGLFNALPLEHLQILHICYNTDSTFSDWPGIFCGCINLWHISLDCVVDDGKMPVIDQLFAIDLSPQTIIMPPPFPPFPSLKSLNLCDVDFGRVDKVHDKFLTWLGRWGPFKTLFLKGSIINTALTDRLKALPFELIIYD